MSPQLHRLALAFAAAFSLIALASGYWGYARQTALLERVDNPRRLLAERRVPRGAILDRRGVVLAESAGEPGTYARRYPYSDLAPVLGYVSVIYGSAGVEAAADGVLHGDAGHDALSLYWQDRVLGAPPPGRGVRLTIDVRLQTAADAALADRAGALVLLDAVSGEILALASHPTYDPNQLDQQWESLVSDARAPLLNRATLALYQPGAALYPVVLAGALRSGLASAGTPFSEATAEAATDGFSFGCRRPPDSDRVTLAQAFIFGCPRPFAALGEQMGARLLGQLFADFRLYEAPPLAIPTTASPRTDLDSEVPLAAVGQGGLNITPLHLALITAAIARQGELPAPRLILATQKPDLTWEPASPLSHPIAAIAPEHADEVKALMTTGYTAVAYTGPAGAPLAWFAGFAPVNDSRYAIAILLEDGDAVAAAAMGQELLMAATELMP